MTTRITSNTLQISIGFHYNFHHLVKISFRVKLPKPRIGHELILWSKGHWSKNFGCLEWSFGCIQIKYQCNKEILCLIVKIWAWSMSKYFGTFWSANSRIKSFWNSIGPVFPGLNQKRSSNSHFDIVYGKVNTTYCQFEHF